MKSITFYKNNETSRPLTLRHTEIVAGFMGSEEYDTYQESRNFSMSICCFMAKYGSYDIFENGELDDLHDIMRDIERGK